MTELDVLLEDFNNELKEIKDKYEFIINKKISELNLPEEKYRNLIRKMGKDFYQFSTELFDDINFLAKELAEKRLMESEKNLQYITEKVNDVIIILNKDLKIEYINELPLNRIAGYQGNDLIGKNGMDYIHPDDHAKALKELIKSFKTGEASIELRLKHKDGHYVWTETKGNILLDRDKIPKAHIIVRDISQRKIAEEQLRISEERLRLINLELEEQVKKRNEKLKESEEKYRQLFENSPNMIILIDSDGLIIDVNSAFLTRLRIKREDLIGNEFRNIEGFVIRNLDLLKDKFNEMLKQGKIKPFEIQIYDKDDKLKWVNIQASSINLGSKILIQAIIQDIDDMMNAEKRLKESEEKYRLITENVNDLLVIVNESLEFEWMNETVHKKLRGFSNKDRIGKPALKFIHPDDIDIAMKTFKEGFKKGEGMGEIRMQNKEGGYNWLEVRGKTFTDNEGKKEALLISRDITERKLSEQKLKESEEKFRTIAENSLIGITLIQDNQIKYINIKVADMLGYSVEEMLQWDYSVMLKHIYSEDTPLVMAILEEILHNPEIKSSKLELRALTKTGQIIWLENFYAQIQYHGRSAQLITSVDITERKKAEQKLKESEGKYKALFEESPYSIVLLDLEGNFVDCNPARLKIFGRTKEELIGKNFRELSLFPPEHQKIAEEAFNTLLKEKFAEPIIVKSYNKDGNLIWSHIQGKIINLDEKTLVQIITQDIHERKIAEQKLRESEERFRTLFEVAPASIMVADLDSNILMCNYQFCKLHGFDNPELVKGRKFPEFISEKDQLKFSEGVKKTLMEKPRGLISYTMLKNDGTEFPAEATSATIKDNDGNIIGFIGVAQDITERKKAEEIVKESEEKFRTIAEQSFMGIVIIQDEKLKYVNEAAAKMFEYSLEEVMDWSKDHMVKKCIYPEDLPMLREKRELRRKGEFNLKPYISYRVLTKSGKIKWIDQFSRIIMYQGKEAELVTIIDITDQKKAEKLIIEENKKLLELDKMRKELITRVSHELKTPLVSIFSCSELLIDYYKAQMSEEVLKFIEIIHRGGQRLKDLIKNLLDASQIDSGKLRLKRENVNLIEIIRNCINFVEYLVEDRKISLEYKLPEELFIEVDKIRIEQVITNLLSNAIKNTPLNGNISLDIKEEDNNIYISFQDTGVGLTKEEMDKIFKKFGKIERYGKELDVDIEGSGLGLYISKEIINLHEGVIWVESEGRNKGATFTIKLPIKKEENQI